MGLCYLTDFYDIELAGVIAIGIQFTFSAFACINTISHLLPNWFTYAVFWVLLLLPIIDMIFKTAGIPAPSAVI